MSGNVDDGVQVHAARSASVLDLPDGPMQLIFNLLSSPGCLTVACKHMSNIWVSSDQSVFLFNLALDLGKKRKLTRGDRMAMKPILDLILAKPLSWLPDINQEEREKQIVYLYVMIVLNPSPSSLPYQRPETALLAACRSCNTSFLSQIASQVSPQAKAESFVALACLHHKEDSEEVIRNILRILLNMSDVDQRSSSFTSVKLKL